MTTENNDQRPARIVRVAATTGTALLLLLISVVTCACDMLTNHAAVLATSTVPHPCVVGGEGCGPLPMPPTDGPLSYDFARPSPRSGPLRARKYSSATNQTGIHVGFTVPAGWSWNGRTLSKGNAAVSFYASPVLVYADPCHWNRPQHRVVKRVLASGYSIIPTFTRRGKLFAQAMRHVAQDDTAAIRLTVPSNIDISRCDHGQYRTWGTGANTLLAKPGQRDLIWISSLAWSPTRLIVDAATFPTTPRRLVRQVNAILASVGACAACG